MPDKVQNIGPNQITRGNDKTLKFTIATTVDLVSARFWIKQKYTDADGAALIHKTVTTSGTIDGQITDATQPSAVIQIYLSEAETASFTAGKPYYWDLEVFDGNSKATTPIGGKISFDQRVRAAIG